MLGTASAQPDIYHNNTFMALQGESGYALIDCGGCPMQALQSAQLPFDELQRIIVTHRHPDHMYGLPVLILGLWLCGRSRPLLIQGEQESLATASALFEIFRSEEWPSLFSLLYDEIAVQPNQLVFEDDEFRIVSMPVKHLVPTLALKIVCKASGKTTVYSSDTEPCDALVEFARGADMLIHEATGEGIGHSSSAQAAQIALRAGVGELILVHLPVLGGDLDGLHQAAVDVFGDKVRIAHDYDVFDL